LTAIHVKEELSAPAIIFVTRSDVPPSPAASFLIDLIKRAAGRIGSNQDQGNREPRPIIPLPVPSRGP
jgi:hypothetical protein